MEGQLHALLAMSVCKYEAQDLRADIIYDLNSLLKDNEKTESVRMQALFDGLKGIALQNEISDDAQTVAASILNLLEKKLGDTEYLPFDKKLELLWSACALGIEQDSKLVKNLHCDI